MKKVLVFCCAVLMVMSMGVVAYAATGSFVSSPTGNLAPTVEEFEAAEGCTSELKVTPYSERADLPQELEDLTEQAYNEIRGTEDLTELNDDLGQLAEDMKIEGDNLAVSDLFTLHTEGCENHEGHEDFDITLSSDKLANFVGLMYMNAKGEWVLVKDAKVVNGEHLVFTSTAVGPYAIVVKDAAAPTGETAHTWLYVAIMAASATAMLLVWNASKKQQA
ncbi:MAG: hypothetical protein E7552_07865 [Ruminococcaceae bacterium]|nr:hypothetical protein [Oscillospiraceae bacterium]